MVSEHAQENHENTASSVAFKTRLLPYAFPALICVFLLVNCVIVSAKKPFWFDEMLTYQMASDTPFSHMFAGVRSYFNPSPPLYNIVIWLWARAFGTSELALRLPSSLCFGGAFGVLWLTLRSRFGTVPVFLGIAAALTSHLNDYNAEARGYGLFLFCCALTIYQFAAFAEQPKRAWSFYAANTLFHLCMVMTHLFGFLYSASLLLVVLCLDVKRRRVSIPMYGSVLLAWVLFAALWLKTTLHQAGAFKPYSWVPVPHLQDVLNVVLMDKTRMLALMAAGIVACIVLARLAKQPPVPASSAFNDDWHSPGSGEDTYFKSMALLAGLFLVVPPVVVYVVSHVSASVFVDRYFMPSMLAWAILLTFVASELHFRLKMWRQSAKGPFPQRMLVCIALLLMLAVTVKNIRRTATAVYDHDIASLPAAQNMPIVCGDYCYFLTHAHYSARGSSYYFLLDEEASMKSAPACIGWEMVEYKVMQALHDQYPALAIMDWRAFLRTHDQFVLVAAPTSPWSDVRLLSNPEYDCTTTLNNDHTLIWVHKKH